ncbi:hypothetical protein CJF32_00004135 [Rutstroemia sp. NJR-2017a WRK4]|nr:hypothetical protein CJF32_00004135 [Rutstroemia sp. NJR-2017a WRK4]
MSHTASGVLIADIQAGMLPARVRIGSISSPMSPAIKPRNLRKELGMTCKDRVQKRPKPSECPYRCRYPKCGRGYTSQKTFRTHVRQMHESGDANKCKHCPHKSPTAKALDAHCKAMHFMKWLKVQNETSAAEKKKEEEKEKKMAEKKKSKREESAESDDTVASNDSGYSSFPNDKTKQTKASFIVFPIGWHNVTKHCCSSAVPVL